MTANMLFKGTFQNYTFEKCLFVCIILRDAQRTGEQCLIICIICLIFDIQNFLQMLKLSEYLCGYFEGLGDIL